MPKIKPTTETGNEYTAVRKVPWDELWHLCYNTLDGKPTWDRVDRETALALAKRI